LSREEGIELARSVDASLELPRAEALWEQARGSPFWLEALSRAGGAAGGISELLTVRLRVAGPDASTALAFLAVAGRPVTATDACEVLAWPETRVAAAVEELARRGLVVQALGGIRLAHDLIRQSALPELS